jgi:hypothetical protein
MTGDGRVSSRRQISAKMLPKCLAAMAAPIVHRHIPRAIVLRWGTPNH